MPDKLRRAHQLSLLLGASCLSLLVVVAYLAARRPLAGTQSPSLPRSEEVMQRAVVELVAEARGLSDSHPDPDVSRLLLPGLTDREYKGLPLSSNQYGMREKDYLLPKPDDVLRIVILGDSFVFGSGVREDQRLGSVLERFLRERVQGFEGQIECLHLGVFSWNVGMECAYLRRQLGLLRPDLVFQVLVENDLDDSTGVRGFGAVADHNPEHKDGRIQVTYAMDLGFRTVPLLPQGLDHESRERYARAGAHLQRLAEAVQRSGGSYVAILRYPGIQYVARECMVSGLDPAQVVFLSDAFCADPAFRLSRADYHWSVAGHERMAQLLYGLITRRELLADVEVPRWPAAEEAVRDIAEVGRAESGRVSDAALEWRRVEVQSIDFDELSEAEAAVIYGGVRRNGAVAPHASLVLKRGDATVLHVQGRRLRRPELRGERVTVVLDGEPAAHFQLVAQGDIDLEIPLPPANGLPLLNVRFEASDYCYTGTDLRRCTTFYLDRIWLETR